MAISSLVHSDSLEFAVITGCLRISKESIFTGLNNLEVNSIRSFSFKEAFGFTQAEVETMLRDYGLEDRIEEARFCATSVLQVGVATSENSVWPDFTISLVPM